MPIYRIEDEQIVPVESTTFKEQGLKERSDLQPLLKSRIDVISPDTLVVGEECSVWKDSSLRIDLLGIDKDANIVVFELKRTESGGHMELQAIRYAAMISTLTFDRLVPIYEEYLSQNNVEKDAKDHLLEFLDWDDPREEEFGQKVRIVLASAEFSKELTTSVLWLNDHGLDIRCVRMCPCDNDGQILLDVQTVIPIPEAEGYQVGIQEKKQRERASRKSGRDYSRYDVTIGSERYSRQSKRRMMLLIVSKVLKGGGTPEQILEIIPRRKLRWYEGDLDSEQVRERLDSDGTVRSDHFFCGDGELIHVEGRTCFLSKRWGRSTLDNAEKLAEKFPDLKITLERVEQEDA